MSQRCTGHCCKRFALPYSPTELERAYAAWHASKPCFLSDDGKDRQIPQDIHLVYPMVIPLGMHRRSPATGEYLGEAIHHYSCKHYDHTKQECTIYEQRPRVCRTYPDGNNCRYKHCTLDPKDGSGQ